MSTPNIIEDIIAACQRIKSVGEQPSRIRMSREFYERLRNPKWSPLKGTARMKKRQRFRRRKVCEWLELQIDNPPAIA